MTSRIHTIASLMMISATLAATPSLAAPLTSGNPGPSERAVNRDAPLLLPAGIAPRPTPKLETATLTRGLFDQDPEAALAGLASVTLDRSGEVSETPASDALRDIFESSVRGRPSGT